MRRSGRRSPGTMGSLHGGRLELPRHSYGHRQPDPPHRKRVLARFTDGQGVQYEVCTNWPRTAWWASASKAGLRMSNALRTTTAKKGTEWIAAVEAGNVRLADRS